jgi:tetratricopeptide (TPR) repeat protein
MPALRRHIGPLWKHAANIAQELQLSGDLDRAEKYYRLSVRLAKHARGRSHEDVGEAYINLADFMMSVANYRESEACYRNALSVYERLFGKDNLIAAMIYRVLAEIYAVQHRLGEAKLLQQRSLAILGERQAS